MVTFRALREDDFDLRATWLARDHVHEWWKDPSTPVGYTRLWLGVLDSGDPGDAGTAALYVRRR